VAEKRVSFPAANNLSRKFVWKYDPEKLFGTHNLHRHPGTCPVFVDLLLESSVPEQE
jgi:hypothetical protein